MLIKKLLSAVFFLAFILNLKAQDNPCNTKEVPYSSFPQDTTIKLPSGTTITLNRCEFFDMRDCLEIIEINDTAGLSANGMNMYDRNGNVLITCGMFKIDLKGCGKDCFDVPIKMRIKVMFQNCVGPQNVLPRIFIGRNGRWERDTSNNSKIITINNETFIEYISKCPVMVNCDIAKPGRIVKFVAPKRQKIGQLKVGTNCPLFYTDERLPNPKKRLRMRIPCMDPERTGVEAILWTKNDEKIVPVPRKLSDLNHGNAKVNCKEKRSFFASLFGWLKRSKGNFHKKYYL